MIQPTSLLGLIQILILMTEEYDDSKSVKNQERLCKPKTRAFTNLGLRRLLMRSSYRTYICYKLKTVLRDCIKEICIRCFTQVLVKKRKTREIGREKTSDS